MTYESFVALGDSLVAGTGDDAPGLKLVRFPDRFADTLKGHSPDLSYVNLARNGATSQDLIDYQLSTALELQPDLVMLGIGANDTLDSRWTSDITYANIDAALSVFSKRKTTIITLTYVDAASVLRDGAAPWLQLSRPRMEEVCAAVGELSARYRTIFVDFWGFTLLFTIDDWSADGIHPNALGHLKGAQLLIRVFSEHTGIQLPIPE